MWKNWEKKCQKITKISQFLKIEKKMAKSPNGLPESSLCSKSALNPSRFQNLGQTCQTFDIFVSFCERWVVSVFCESLAANYPRVKITCNVSFWKYVNFDKKSEMFGKLCHKMGIISLVRTILLSLKHFNSNNYSQALFRYPICTSSSMYMDRRTKNPESWSKKTIFTVIGALK